MSTPDLTFTVHPRPPDQGGKLSDAVSDPALSVEPTRAKATIDDGQDGPDTFLANLAFLVRFAFGRH
ncbi:hypothetical protein [Lichenibacterium ramalinae]|uniref:Uncharacterized protein n=1 Tax=Lichenibacterium ramalinae TaxID=2316527 RepID=A0A4V1RI38_9HYPH|nr:hypothetical protein [Lichenibacterium ramalinae]RYB02199.1 hypothetical protein D3272_22230 [Lichenibacterium ramalinae]